LRKPENRHNKSPHKYKTILGKSPKKERAIEGEEVFDGMDEDEISNGSFVKNTELELLRVNQRLLSLEGKLQHETDHLKEFLTRATKEQQFYIETLHQDLEIMERNRVKKYKEEEAERARLMEDIIRLYEKIKSQDGSTNVIEKKINYINDRVAKFKVMTDRRPLSPKQAEIHSDYASITPGRLGETAS